jgi:uncharacterized protein
MSNVDVIPYSIRNGQVVFNVQVVPRSSRSQVLGEYNRSLRVKIAAPPVDGAANEELIRVLAKKFSVARSAVTIISGRSSKVKQISIEGPADDIAALLNLKC